MPNGDKVKIPPPYKFSNIKQSKHNRKNRKLEYIRYKNRLRTGKAVFTGYIKYTETQDDELLKIILEELQKTTFESLFKKYRITLRNQVLDFGYNGDDFIRNEITARLTLSNRKP